MLSNMKRKAMAFIGMVPVRLIITGVMILLGLSVMFTLYNAAFGVEDDLGTLAERLRFIVEDNNIYDPTGERPPMYARTMFLSISQYDDVLVFFAPEQEAVTTSSLVTAPRDRDAPPGFEPPPDTTSETVSFERPQSCNTFFNRDSSSSQQTCICVYALAQLSEEDNNPRACTHFKSEELTILRTMPADPSITSLRVNIRLSEETTSLFTGDQMTYAQPIISYEEAQSELDEGKRALILYIEYIPSTNPPTLVVTPLTDELSEQIDARAAALSQQP